MESKTGRRQWRMTVIALFAAGFLGVTLSFLTGAGAANRLLRSATCTNTQAAPPVSIVDQTPEYSANGGGLSTTVSGLPDRSSVTTTTGILPTGTSNASHRGKRQSTCQSKPRSSPRHRIASVVSIHPLTTDPGHELCNPQEVWVLVTGSSSLLCVWGDTTNWNATNGLPAEQLELINDTGVRVWLHQNPDGSGWADCFNWGAMFVLGGRDISAGNLYISNNQALCSAAGAGNESTRICDNVHVPFAGYLAQSQDSQDECFQTTATYTHLNLPLYVVINGYLGRVWLHQYADSSGWADCFNNGVASMVSSTRDANAGNFQTTDNYTDC